MVRYEIRYFNEKYLTQVLYFTKVYLNVEEKVATFMFYDLSPNQ